MELLNVDDGHLKKAIWYITTPTLLLFLFLLQLVDFFLFIDILALFENWSGICMLYSLSEAKLLPPCIHSHLYFFVKNMFLMPCYDRKLGSCFVS